LLTHPANLSSPRKVRDEAGPRRVAAERLLHYRDNCYLVGWCLQRRAWRHFAVERITAPFKVENQRSRPTSPAASRSRTPFQRLPRTLDRR
jgi:predicted DNA-binding transcriptional regulator YafY